MPCLCSTTRPRSRSPGTRAGSAPPSDLDFADHDYSDVEAFDGSRIDQDFRDMTSYGAYLGLNYRFSPGYKLLTSVRAGRELYHDADAELRDATVYEGKVGLAFELSPLWRAYVSVGYGLADYDSEERNRLGAFVYDGQLVWLASPLLTMTLTAGQSIEEASFGTEGALIETHAEIEAKYEAMRNLMLTASLGYEQADIANSHRTDDVYTGSIGAEYTINKNVLFTLGYEHQERFSTDIDYEMQANRYTAGFENQVLSHAVSEQGYEIERAEAPASAMPTLADALRLLRRRASIIVAVAFIGAALAYAAGLLMQPVYEASATVELSSRKTQISDIADVVTQLDADSPTIDSQIEIIQSTRIAGRVVDQLQLAKDPEFQGDAGWRSTLKSKLDGLLGRSADPGPVPSTRPPRRATPSRCCARRFPPRASAAPSSSRSPFNRKAPRRRRPSSTRSPRPTSPSRSTPRPSWRSRRRSGSTARPRR